MIHHYGTIKVPFNTISGAILRPIKTISFKEHIMYRTDSSKLQETKQHGSILFPFNIYPCTIPMDFPSVSLHWHKSMELIYVKKGHGQIQMGNKRFPAQAGDIFVVPPAILHAIYSIAGHTMEYENFIFQPEFLGSGVADVCARQYLIPLADGRLLHPVCISPTHPKYNDIAHCLQFAEVLCEDKAVAYEIGVKAAMLELILHMIRLQPVPPTRESTDTLRLKQVLQLIQEKRFQKLTVAQAAESCGFSTSHFMRWFRERTGSSFSSYVNKCRLAAAAEKLRQTNYKILTIAVEAGFESLANFNRQFKAVYGVTPSAYRQKYRTSREVRSDQMKNMAASPMQSSATG